MRKIFDWKAAWWIWLVALTGAEVSLHTAWAQNVQTKKPATREAKLSPPSRPGNPPQAAPPTPSAQASRPPQGIPPQWIREATTGINGILERHWKTNSIPPNPPAGDEIFVRRLYLDVVGRIPTLWETVDFLRSTAPDKRERLIHNLLHSEGYVHHFYNVWADILRVQSHSPLSGAVTGGAYMNFIKDSLRSNKPYDVFVKELITAEKPSWENGAVGYHIRDRGMNLDAMAITSQIFLGTRIECAQCHNHPFDKWRQLDFYRMAAYTYPIDETEIFSSIGLHSVLGQRTRQIDEQWRKDRPSMGEAAAKKKRDETLDQTANPHRALRVLRMLSNPFVADTKVVRKDRELKLPHDYHYDNGKPGDVISPQPLYGKASAVGKEVPRDRVFADWLASPANPRFNAVIVNRLLRQVFGRSLLEPLDELRDDSKASVPELETYLERVIVAMRYDMRAFLEALLNSRAYQAECDKAEPIPDGRYAFAGPVLRRMTAEQIWDSCVALMRPDPDAYNASLREVHEERMRRARKAFDMFRAISSDRLLDMALSASSSFQKDTSRIQRIQAQLDEAKEKGDAQAVSRLSKEMLGSGTVDREVIDNVFYPMLVALAQQKGVQSIPPREVLRNNIRLGMDLFPITGYDIPEPSAEQRNAARQARARAWSEQMAGIPFSPGEQEKFTHFLETGRNEWVRAAELESPAPRGHFLRELGQSDRDLVENSNGDASVSQALIFMNGGLIARTISAVSPVILRVRSGPNLASQLELACLTLFSRQPTPHEWQVFEKAPANARTPEALVHALLNTRQFLFIQ